MPTLVLDDGTILNENAATLQYIADLAPGKVAPLTGTTDRALLQNALSYISGEVHGSIGPLFGSLSAEVIKPAKFSTYTILSQNLSASILTRRFGSTP